MSSNRNALLSIGLTVAVTAAILGLVLLHHARRAEGAETLAYCTGAQGEPLWLDLERPHQGTGAAVVFLHSGGPEGGDKQGMGVPMSLAAQQGILGVAPNYGGQRADGGVDLAQSVADSKCAVRWLRAHAGELGIDPGRVGVFGGSFGGYLAFMLATTRPEDGFEGTGGWEEESSAVRATAAVVGPVDLATLYYTTARPELRDQIALSLGGSPEVAGSTYNFLSPLRYVRPGVPVVQVQCSTADTTVPPSQGALAVEALRRAGGRVEVVVVPLVPHGPPTTPAALVGWGVIWRRAVGFLVRELN